MEKLVVAAKQASLGLQTLSIEQRDQALNYIKLKLESEMSFLVSENQKDLAEQKDKLSEAMYSRLIFNEKKISTLISGIDDIVKMKDPIGAVELERSLTDGLELKRISTPLGVIAIVFESRPDVAVQIGCLLLKSGNAGILKGGKEAHHTLRAIEQVMNDAVKDLSFIPQGWLTFIQSREDVNTLLGFEKYIDLVIPRGSNDLVRYIMSNTKIPVLGHADGICHLYVSEDFSVDKALKLIHDSKMQSPGTCNALETLLVHESKFAEVRAALKGQHPDIELIESPDSWAVEYSSPELAIKSVGSLDEAIGHINTHGSHHTDCILSNNPGEQAEFLARVDSGNVFVNCSTRFSDGFRYGFGAEIGISTSKIHARGPVGLEGLISYKYQLIGDGHLVKDFKG